MRKLPPDVTATEAVILFGIGTLLGGLIIFMIL